MKPTLKTLDTKVQEQFAELRGEMRGQFNEVHQRIDTLHFKIDAMDEKIDDKLDVRFAEQKAEFIELLDARFSKHTAELVQGLSPWMRCMDAEVAQHNKRITQLERREAV